MILKNQAVRLKKRNGKKNIKINKDNPFERLTELRFR